MKKFIGFVLSLLLLTGLTVSTASAQHNYGRGRSNYGRIVLSILDSSPF